LVDSGQSLLQPQSSLVTSLSSSSHLTPSHDSGNDFSLR
jgi:hypothetical protein